MMRVVVASTRREDGFTFIELMMTLAILAVLVLIATPMAQLAAQREKERELRHALIQIRDALDAYKRAAEQGRIQMRVGDSGYPRSLEQLVAGVPDQRSPTRQNLYFLRSLPRDPMSDDANARPADTWGTRCHASPPDDPAEGDDVFDIYSRSGKLGLNGVPYKAW